MLLMNDNTLQIAEVPYENGSIKFRYARYMSEDGTRWIRHGLFQALHENGGLSSEGTYKNGLEAGIWKDFHENGQVAAQGEYIGGKQVGVWRYWDSSGNPEGIEDLGKI